MPKFGKRSKERLATCDHRLVAVFDKVIQQIDCSVLEGIRTKEKQDRISRSAELIEKLNKRKKHGDC